MSRIENSIKNLATGFGGYFLRIFVQFVSRRAFILLLGEEYLGVNGLFSNILMLLSLAELGFGSAITFSLYKPLAEKDWEAVKSLMGLFKKAYTIIGCTVFLLGFALVPFLDFFVDSSNTVVQNVRLIYILYLLNSSVSYLFTYKRTLIIADQKERIITICSSISVICLNLVQIFVLYISKSFELYLIVMIVFTVFENVLISQRANALYPCLKEKNVSKLTKEEIAPIFKNIKALIFHQVGRSAVNGTSNLLIAKLVDLASVGRYSNYTMINSSVNTVSSLVFNAIYASVGNSNVTETYETKELIFNRVNFLSSWIYCFCTTCLFCLFNPFISLWIGKNYLFPLHIEMLICINFFVLGMRNPVLITKNAMGLYWQDRYKPIVESIVHLGVSFGLGRAMGLTGILIGSIASCLLVNFTVEPIVLYKHGLKSKVVNYYKQYFVTIVITGIAVALTFFVTNLVPGDGILSLFGRAIICCIVPNVVLLVAYIRNNQFKYFVSLAKKILLKR